jgi:hypothetical protein
MDAWCHTIGVQLCINRRRTLASCTGQRAYLVAVISDAIGLHRLGVALALAEQKAPVARAPR